ncbi:hypothetical protein, partial [Methanobrevibacter sp. UBA212]|uniref:hypothetical protein n=1 Tax=Methanobrevibacter sp. UBA212 TaxID=1915476 RepID=UPI0025D2CE69
YIYNNRLYFIVYKIKGKINKKNLKISEFVSHPQIIVIFSKIIFKGYFSKLANIYIIFFS